MNAHTGELMAVEELHSLEGRHLELARVLASEAVTA
jgi:hypothetical protein